MCVYVYIYVKGFDFDSVPMNFLLQFGTVSTAYYFSLLVLHFIEKWGEKKINFILNKGNRHNKNISNRWNHYIHSFFSPTLIIHVTACK